MNSHDLIRALEAYAGLEPPAICWMGGVDADQGLSFCRPCAEKRAAAGQGDFVDGGWGGDECDGLECCEDCGVLLDYTLTDYGANSEREHFRENGCSSPVAKAEAYEIARIVAALPNDKDVWRIANQALASINGQE